MRDDGRHVLFVCEGSAEAAILETLIESGDVAIPASRIVENPETGKPYTTSRSGSAISERFLNFNYGGRPLRIVRLLDSRNEKFILKRGYEGKATVETLLTRPEIEILVIHHLDAYDQWSRSGKKPSVFCKEDLHLSRIKRYEDARAFWADPEDLRHAILTYARTHRYDSGEQGLEQLLAK